MSNAIAIREPRATDESGWRQLWADYNDFYRTRVSDEITAFTWKRILDPHSPIFGRLAEIDGRLVGFSVSVLHEGTWVADPICYLEDLFVEPKARSKGVGRDLIEDIISLGKTKGWSRLYWHTKHDNPARRLYDEFIAADDFVRYRLDLPNK